MNMQKKLNVVLAILAVILVSLISFGGIYYRNKSEMSNRIPQYLLGTDLKGYRQVTLEVAEDEDNDNLESNDSEEDEEEVQESDENVADESEEDENSESEEQEKIVDNKENYKKSAEIYKDRLKSLKVDNYSVSCDEETGRIVITLPENDQTDIILSDLAQQGKFSIKDNQTEEDLLTNEDVRKVEVGRTESTTGTLTTYMSVYFNTKGTSKFKNVTKDYQNIVEENTSDENEESDESEENDEEVNDEEESDESTDEEETSEEETEEEENEEDEDDNSGKQITLNIDDVTMMTTSFEEIIDNGVLSLTLGTSEDATMDELYSAYNLAAIIENDAIPIKYEISGNTYISSVIEENEIRLIIYVEIGIALAIMLIMIAKYRVRGIFASIMSVGYMAILLIVVRYANVTLSILGLFALELCYAINCIYSFMKFEKIKNDKLTQKEKQKSMKELLRNYTLLLVPELIIAIVCCFTQWTQLLSFGMIIFWGTLISLAYNIIINQILD